MITDFLVHALALVVSTLFSFVPNIPTSWASSVATWLSAVVAFFHTWIQPWNYYVMLKFLMTCVLIVFGMEFAYSIWSGIVFVISVLRGMDHG